MSVLIAEDNVRMRETIKAIVLPLAVHMLECDDGARAVELYLRTQPDWVLMDIAMTGMDGLEATRRIRASDPNARVVIVTDHDTPVFRRAASAAGACAFVAKTELVNLLDVMQPTWEES